jgi:hypothetical protein
MAIVSTEETPRRRSRAQFQPSSAVSIAIIVAFVFGVFLTVRSTTPGSTTPTLATGGGSTSTTAVVSKAQVRVQVANGTLINGLARSTTQNLMTLGWNTLPELNGPHVSSTVIYYNPGFAWAANEVAQEIHVPSSAVAALNGLNPVSGAASDDVIIVLGPDAANQG